MEVEVRAFRESCKGIEGYSYFVKQYSGSGGGRFEASEIQEQLKNVDGLYGQLNDQAA